MQTNGLSKRASTQLEVKELMLYRRREVVPNIQPSQHDASNTAASPSPHSNRIAEDVRLGSVTGGAYGNTSLTLLFQPIQL